MNRNQPPASPERGLVLSRAGKHGNRPRREVSRS
jgi:hypothetical protein